MCVATHPPATKTGSVQQRGWSGCFPVICQATHHEIRSGTRLPKDTFYTAGPSPPNTPQTHAPTLLRNPGACFS